MNQFFNWVGLPKKVQTQNNQMELELDSMLQVSATEKVLIELTSRCNLKCPFCTVSHPEYRGGDNTVDIDELIPRLNQRGVRRVEINNHGESTIISGWEKVAEKLLSKGFEVSITSNLAKSFSDQEINILAQMTVYLSIDTVDSDLFRKLRLGAKIERVIANVNKIQSRKQELASSKPFGWRTILCDATYPGLLDLIQLGLNLNITEFYFGHLQKMEGVKTSYDVNHILTLPPEKVAEALIVLGEARHILENKKAIHDLDKCINQIKQAVHPEIISFTNPDPEACSPFELAPKATFNEQIGPKETRNCLLPWNMFQIKHNQNITFCCWMKSLGNLKGESLDHILNGEQARAYRKGLLTGELMPECKVCPVRESIPLQYQIQNVKNYLGKITAASSSDCPS